METEDAEEAESLTGARHGDKRGRKPTVKAQKLLSLYDGLAVLTAEQRRDIERFAEELGVVVGEPMGFEQADSGNCNPVYDKSNCAAVVAVMELRRRGLDVVAKPYNETEGSASRQLSADTRLAWLTDKGQVPELTKLDVDDRRLSAKLNSATATVGARYHLGWDNNGGDGHIITLERTPMGLLFFDPQSGRFESLDGVLDDVKSGSLLELLRVDRLLVNSELMRHLVTVVGKAHGF